jgi:hypothetical protein
MTKSVGSKKIAASWMKNKYGKPWSDLISTAEQWHYGISLDLQERAIEFLDFVIKQVSKTKSYSELNDEIKLTKAALRDKQTSRK